jgi:hypothetical protein
VSTLFGVSPEDVAVTNDDWYTPRWVFNAAGLTFDMDVCAPVNPAYRTCPAREYLTVVEDGLMAPWRGLVWMNPPYGEPSRWVDRFADHGRGLALLQMPKRAKWQAKMADSADALAILTVVFSRPDGSQADLPWPLVMFAAGPESVSALARVAAADKYARGAYHVRPDRICTT